MAIPASGALTLAMIQTEFGGTNPISLSEYYAGGANVPSGTTGTYGAVPTSGAISIRDFYGTSNVVYSLPGGGYYVDFAFDPNDAGITFTMLSNGTYLIDADNGGFESGNWITPTTGSTTHYVRATLTGGTFSSGSAVGSWLQLNTNRAWRTVFTGAFGTKITSATFEVATDAAGTDVRVTASVTLEASVEV